MNAETYGMFGPRGLLSRIETEDDSDSHSHSHKSLHKFTENIDDHSTSDNRLFVLERTESCDTPDQLTNVQDLLLRSTSKTNSPIAVVPLCNLSPVEGAFSIDKISKSIFSLLEPSDLLSCRLVSSSWLRMATNQKLLKWNKQAIQIGHSHNLQCDDPADVRVKGVKRQLKDVTDFLDNLGSHPLLCSARLDLNITITPNDFFKFLDRYGFVVNSLEVTFQAKENEEYFVYHMDSLLVFVTKLLTEQMPNLETLVVYFEKHSQFEGEIDQQLLLSIKNGLYFAGKHNQNLRTIEFGQPTPYEIIETVCCLAPKVENLQVHDLGFFFKYKHRLHLLKTLYFVPSLRRWDQVNAVKALVNLEGKFNLITLHFLRVLHNPEVWPDLATLVTKIFEKSFDSLEELDLDPIYFFLGAVLPPVMPQVKVIFLNSYPTWSSEGSFVVPQKISLVSTFPILHTVKCSGETGIKRFLSLCKDEEVASVERIKTLNCDMDKEIFRKYFPNAVVTDCLASNFITENN